MKPSDIKKQLEQVKQNLQVLYSENGYDLACYDKYFRLSPADRARVRREWDAYYEACRKSPSERAYRTQLDAFRQDDMPTVRQLTQEARQRLGSPETVTPPRFPVDPVAFDHASLYVIYRTLLSRQRDLERRQKTDGQSFDL